MCVCVCAVVLRPLGRRGPQQLSLHPQSGAGWVSTFVFERNATAMVFRRSIVGVRALGERYRAKKNCFGADVGYESTRNRAMVWGHAHLWRRARV